MSGGLSGGKSSSSSSNYIDKNQLPFLQNLWGGGQGLMNQQMGGGMGANAMQSAGDLYGQGQGFLNQLTGPYQQSESAQGQLAALQQGLGQQSERLMQGVGQQGVQAGQFGQSRGDIGRGMVAEGAQNAYAQGAGDIMGRDQAIQSQNAMAGLNSLQGMFGLGQSGYMQQWMPYQMQAGLVGSPTVVGDSSSSAWNMGVQGGVA